MQYGQPRKYPWGKLPDSELAGIDGFEEFIYQGKIREPWPRGDVLLQRGSRSADKQEVIAALDNQFPGFGGDYTLHKEMNDGPRRYRIALDGQKIQEAVDLKNAAPAAYRLSSDTTVLAFLNMHAGSENTWDDSKRSAQGEWNEKTIQFLKHSKQGFERSDSRYLRDGIASTYRCFAKMENAKAAQEFAYGYSQLWLCCTNNVALSEFP